MTQLAPGQNVALPQTPATLSVEVGSTADHVDVIALLLDDDDTADGDNGVVLFSNLTAADGKVVLDLATDTITIDVATLPADVHKVLVVAQADGRPTVQGAGTITATVAGDGTEVCSATFEAAATPVATLQLAELYRHGGGWKVRALGDGYAEGLEKLLTVHGVEVDDAPPAAAPAAPAQPAAGPAPAAQPNPASAPTAASVPTAAAAPTPAVDPDPTPAAAAAPTPAAAPDPTPAAAPVNLSKPSLPATGTVSLTKKGQGVTLVKERGGALNKVAMGLGWDPAKSGKAVDLDASCVLLDAAGKKKGAVWFLRKKSKDGSVVHSGDNLTGAGDGDDETIRVELEKVPADVKYLVFTVNSFSGQTFDAISRAYCRLLDDAGNAVVRYELSDMKATTGLIVCALSRGASGWEMTALGDYGQGRTYKKMQSEITAAAIAIT